MNLLKARFGLDDFISEMMRVSSFRLELQQLQDWMSRLVLKDDLFDRHISFAAQTYQRKLICRTPRFDLLILCWQPGQRSSIHDHVDSLNVTRVYRGVLTSRSFEHSTPQQPDRCWGAEPSVSNQSTLNQSTLRQSTVAVSTCPNAPVRLKTENYFHKNDLVSVDRHEIHQLANTTEENLVTLHVYAKPLETITVYCPESGGSESVPVHFNLKES